MDAAGWAGRWGAESGSTGPLRRETGGLGHQHHHDHCDHGVLARGAVVRGQICTTGRPRSVCKTRARRSEVHDSGPDDLYGRRRRDLRRGEGLGRSSESFPVHTRLGAVFRWCPRRQTYFQVNSSSSHPLKEQDIHCILDARPQFRQLRPITPGVPPTTMARVRVNDPAVYRGGISPLNARGSLTFSRSSPSF